MLTANQLLAQVEAFADGDVGLPALRDWFTPHLVESELDVPDGAEALVYQVMFAFEDDSVGEEKHRLNARRLVRATKQIADSSELVGAFWLLRQQDRLGDILRKYFDGVITRVSLLNAISSSGQPSSLKLWLGDASQDQLQALQQALESEDYREVVELTRA